MLNYSITHKGYYMKYSIALLFFILAGCVYHPKELTLNDEPSKADTTTVIYQEGDNTIEEQRIKGFVYSIKVIPKVGKPYYLINSNANNGTLNNSGPQEKIPSWTLLNW